MAGDRGVPPLKPRAPRSVVAPGTLLLGRYRVEGLIGVGGAAEVHRATDVVTGVPVAVKVPDPACLRRESERARFRREVRHLLSVSHPGVVAFLAAGEADGVPFVVLEHLAGGSLADRFKARTPPRDAVGARDAIAGWLGPVAEALDAVHAVGVVHRDVKPSNVLFDAAGRARLADFGLSRAVHGDSSLTPSGYAVGTPDHLAPEQVRDLPLTGAADQYALASVVFEAVAGTPPFPRASLGRLLLMKATERAPSLATAAPWCPVALVDAVARGIERAPQDRYASCAAFAAACLVPA